MNEPDFAFKMRQNPVFRCKYKEFQKDKYWFREYWIYSFCIFSAFFICFFTQKIILNWTEAGQKTI